MRKQRHGKSQFLLQKLQDQDVFIRTASNFPLGKTFPFFLGKLLEWEGILMEKRWILANFALVWDVFAFISLIFHDPKQRKKHQQGSVCH